MICDTLASIVKKYCNQIKAFIAYAVPLVRHLAIVLAFQSNESTFPRFLLKATPWTYRFKPLPLLVPRRLQSPHPLPLYLLPYSHLA